jgi:hypothetical protein
MSELRLNIIDRQAVINGCVHDGIADAVIAALSADPETIAELDAALDRFIKPAGDVRPLTAFREGLCRDPLGGGIIIVDMAARIAAAQSPTWTLLGQGQMLYQHGSELSDQDGSGPSDQDGSESLDLWVCYRAPDDWLFLDSIAEYDARAQARKAEYAIEPLDARAVLYGPEMIDFMVEGCLTAFEARVEDPIAEVHANWLMTPRPDLRSQTPRAVILERKTFIDFDLQFRELQWSFLRQGPPPLGRETCAYRFGGFGTHEWVIYYELIRHLLDSCWNRIKSGGHVDLAAERMRLEGVMSAWLEEPCDDLDHKVPSAIIESERRRIPLTLTAKEMIIDEDCDVCRLMADESEDFGPGFWHLDGCNMDEGFVFSSYRTLDEYKEEERQRQEFSEQFDRKWRTGDLN